MVVTELQCYKSGCGTRKDDRAHCNKHTIVFLVIFLDYMSALRSFEGCYYNLKFTFETFESLSQPGYITLLYTTLYSCTTHILHYVHTHVRAHTLHTYALHIHTHIHTHTHARTHTTLTLTFNSLSEDNSRVLDPKNWTNDTTSAGTVMLMPIEITFSAKKPATPTMKL